MKIISRSTTQTQAIGRSLSRYLKEGDVICLWGVFGSGKTVLTKGIGRGLGLDKSEITSPSYVIIRQYQTKTLPLYHFDLYRLKTADDILKLGYEEYFYGDGVSVIEWPDKLKYLLPKDYLKIELAIKGKDMRQIIFSASGKRHRQLLKKAYENIRG